MGKKTTAEDILNAITIKTYGIGADHLTGTRSSEYESEMSLVMDDGRIFRITVTEV